MVNQVEIQRLVQSKDVEERKRAVEELKNNFSILKDKKQAWSDLHRLTQDNDLFVRSDTADALGSCFSHIPDEYKKETWNDLHRLTKDEDDEVRRDSVHALGSCYSHIPDEYKKEAWADIHRFTQDNNTSVRMGAAYALDACYSQIPNEYKKQAWEDLHRLTQDKDDSVQSAAAVAFGSCYSHIPDKYKEQTWNDLHRLTMDENSDVWITANQSLGRISLYRTSQAKSDESIRNELETALEFFDKASNESIYLDPENFCPPFYHSFYTISFRKEEARAEVKKYLAEAKSALEDLASKKDLLEIVENLGNALNEVHRARDSNEIRSDIPEDTRLFDEIEEIKNEEDKVKPYNPERSSIIGSKTKHCQLCLSEIDIDDKKCVFCGYEPDKKPDFWTISVLIFGIVMVMVTLVMLFGRRYADYEYWPILDNISLIVVLVLFAGLIIYAIYVVVIAIKSLRN